MESTSKETLVNENLIIRTTEIGLKQIGIRIFARLTLSIMTPFPARNTSVLSNICGKEKYSAISSHLQFL
jgi:hypothetical protein